MMQFWGVEVKNGGSVTVKPGDHRVLHISQACVGEIKKGNDCIRLFAEKDGKKFVIGILSSEKFPHINLDLVFEDDFELSHDGKQVTVHFAGYQVEDGTESPDEDDSESDDDLDVPIPVDALNNGKSEAKAKPDAAKANTSSVNPGTAEGKAKVKIVEPSNAVKNEEEDDDSDDDDFEDGDENDESDEDEDAEDMPSAEMESDDEDDSDEEDDSEEETPDKKFESSKKRPVGSTSKTPAPEKKAKFSTPEKKADGKKFSSHVATPHPAKQTAKTPANASKSNKQTPKSAGTIACSSCDRSFGSQQALESHSKAKHSAAK